MIDVAAWFDLDGDAAVPRPHARAPWSEDMLHGRLLAGLAAREVEAGQVDEDWFPAWLTIDLVRSPPTAPVSITSERIRDGGGEFGWSMSGCGVSREVARSRVLVVKASDRSVGAVWSRDVWDLAHPDDLESPPGMGPEGAVIWQFRSEFRRFINGEGAGRC